MDDYEPSETVYSQSNHQALNDSGDEYQADNYASAAADEHYGSTASRTSMSQKRASVSVSRKSHTMATTQMYEDDSASANYDQDDDQDNRIRDLILKTQSKVDIDTETTSCVRTAGSFRIDVASTKFCIEVKAPTIEGPMKQEDVLGELFPQVDFENQARFLSTAVLYWKLDSVEDGARAAVEVVLQKGCASFPARSSIVYRLIQNLRKLYNQLDDTDKAHCLGLRELLAAALLAETTRVPPFSALLRLVDSNLPLLPTPARRAMTTALGRYHEEAARTLRREMNATRQRTADTYRAYRERITQARSYIAELCPALKRHPTALQRVTDLYLSTILQCRKSHAALRVKRVRRAAARIASGIEGFLKHRQISRDTTPLSDAERGLLVELLHEALVALEASPVAARARELAAQQATQKSDEEPDNDSTRGRQEEDSESKVPSDDQDRKEYSRNEVSTSSRQLSGPGSRSIRFLPAASPASSTDMVLTQLEDSFRDRYIQLWRTRVVDIAISLPNESQRLLLAEIMSDQLRAAIVRQRNELVQERKDSVDRIKYMKAKLRDARDMLLSTSSNPDSPTSPTTPSTPAERRHSTTPVDHHTQPKFSEDLNAVDEETRQRAAELMQNAIRDLLELEDAEDEADVAFTLRRAKSFNADFEDALAVIDNTADEHFYVPPAGATTTKSDPESGAEMSVSRGPGSTLSNDELDELRQEARLQCEDLLAFSTFNDEAMMLRDVFVERLGLEVRLDNILDEICFKSVAENDAQTHREILALAEASQSATATAAAAAAASAAAARIAHMVNDRANSNRHRLGASNAKFQEFEWGNDEWYVDADIDAPEVINRAIERLWSEFNRPERTLITGIYTASSTLESIARQDIFLRRGVSKSAAELARRALRQSRELFLSYVAYTDILKQMYNPFKIGQQHWAEAFKDDAGEHCFRPLNMEHEDKFNEAIQLYPKEQAVSALDHLTSLVESDRIKLTPGPYSGHSDRVQYAYESLINADAMPLVEKEKLDRGPLYNQTSRELFTSLYSHQRPQHRVTMQPGGDQFNADYPITELTLRPALTIEPQPRSYLRRAFAVRRLRQFLLRTFGRDALAGILRPLRATTLLQRIESVSLHGDVSPTSVLGNAPSVYSDAVLSEIMSSDSAANTSSPIGQGVPLGSPILRDLEHIEELVAGAYYMTCEELGLPPVDLAAVMAEEDEDGLTDANEDNADDESQNKSSNQDGNEHDEGHHVDCFRDPEGVKIHLRQWVLSLARDPDIGNDMRCVMPVSRLSDGEVTAHAFIGFARKRVMVLFRSIPRVLESFSEEFSPVYPAPKEDDSPDVLYFTCPKCQWELAVPQLDASGAFKCSGDPCAQQLDDLLICLPDGGIVPATLQLDEYWIEYPVVVPLQLGRVWHPNEFRVICDESRDESEIIRATKRTTAPREVLGGLQAQVPYEIIEELNGWFTDIDRKGKGQLSRAVLSGYFTGGGGETGFYTGDTMFYYMDRNEDGWVGLPEFRFAILNIYKKDLAVLRVEKIRALRQKFNTLFKQHLDRIADEKKARERREQFRQRKEREQYQANLNKQYQELMLRAAAVGGLSDSESEPDADGHGEADSDDDERSQVSRARQLADSDGENSRERSQLSISRSSLSNRAYVPQYRAPDVSEDEESSSSSSSSSSESSSESDSDSD